MTNVTVNTDITIKDAMKVISLSGYKCLIVVKDAIVVGTLSDGDIRRAILKGHSLFDAIELIYCTKPICINAKSYDKQAAQKIMLDKMIDVIPIVDEHGAYVDFVAWSKIFGLQGSRGTIDAPVVIMAGGQGTRLKPFTNVFPKPLIPIHGKPIIDHIMGRFHVHGMNQFWITVNYKSQLLKAYFQENTPDYKVKFIQEMQPQGSAGGLKLLAGKVKKPFFVSNCDVLVRSDYIDLYNFHIESQASVTLVASMKQYILPYGTCKLMKNGFLDYIDEKPEFHFLVNTGLYVINPDLLDIIPSEQNYDMDQFISDIKDEGMKVAVYPICNDSWVDIGQWEEYKKFSELVDA